MRKIICDNCQEYEILKWYECKPGDTFLEFDSTSFALSFLHRLGNNPLNMVSIRYAVRESYGVINTSAMTDLEILQQFAEQIAHGHIKLIPKEGLITSIGGFGGGSQRAAEEQRAESGEGTSQQQQAGGSSSRRAGRQQTEETPTATTSGRERTETTTHWIEFRLVDNESNQPMSGIKLRIKLPTGAISEYTSNTSGVIRIDNLPAGTSDIEELMGDDVLEVVQFG